MINIAVNMPSVLHTRPPIYHHLRCFGEHPGDGNPALVIEHDRASPQERQDFARQRATTCVWIDPALTQDTAASLDFYYPHMRSPLCLHATLAAGQLLLARHDAPAELTVTTALHGQRLGLKRDGANVFVCLEPLDAPPADPGRAFTARLLHVTEAQIVSIPRVASVGSPKLLVEVPDREALQRLAPDLAAITDWGRTAGVNGIYAYCRHKDGSFEGRNFNHLEPALEDSATGVAAGALTALLGHGLHLRQGRATGRACLIQTGLEGGVVLVGGRVEAA